METASPTPESPPIEYAGFWLRLLAIIIDSIVLNIIQTVLVIPFLVLFGLSIPWNMEQFNDPDWFTLFASIASLVVAASVISFVIGWLYYALMESGPRQATLGKMALGIKVTDTKGDRVDFGRASLRYVGKIVSGMIFMIGYILAAFTPQKQALHDIMANCLVVRG